VATRPPRDDLYQELGVEREVSADELSAAFRRRAKELHPDARFADPAKTEEFKRVSRAYAVLRDPEQRARYDASRPAGARARPAAGAAGRLGPDSTGSRGATTAVTSRALDPRGAVTRRTGFSRRGARWAVAGGIVLMVVGVVAGAWVLALQRRDAELREDGVAARAEVVQFDGRRRLQFTTRDGEVVVAAESTKSGSGGPSLGSVVGIHYDRDEPTRIVVDISHTARNVTLWIVGVKFVVGGALLVWFGFRRLRR
jgi:hypothetical protein